MKTCTKCKEEKHVTDFYRQKTSPDGFNTQCKTCKQSYEKEKYQDPQIRASIRAKQQVSSLRQRYGISPEQYKELLERQDHKCAICKKSDTSFKVRLAVDHDHSSGEIRGLLCNYCNRRLVGRHRDGDLLRRIAAYVEQGTGWFVPDKHKTTKRRRKK